MALGKNLKKQSTADTDSRHEVSKETASLVSAGEISTTTPESGTHNEAKEDESDEFHQFCVFSAGSEYYAIPIHEVKEVVPIPAIAPLPQMPKHILGMANVRGNIFGVIDLRKIFQLTSHDEEENYFMLVLNHNTYQMSLAIPRVPDTIVVANGAIEKPSASRLKSVLGQKYLKGIIKKDKRMIFLFDILDMISQESFTVAN